MKLAQKNASDIFGRVTPPPGTGGINNTDPATALSNIIVTGIQLVFFAAGVLLLIYLLWGALDWLMSGGEKEKLQKARDKMIHAVLGILILVAVLTLFTVITGNILGIIDISGGGFKFPLP